MSFSYVSVFLFFSFFRFLVKYFQLCICIVTVLLPFVVNKAYHNTNRCDYVCHKLYNIERQNLYRPLTETSLGPKRPQLIRSPLNVVHFH